MSGRDTIPRTNLDNRARTNLYSTTITIEYKRVVDKHTTCMSRTMCRALAPRVSHRRSGRALPCGATSCYCMHGNCTGRTPIPLRYMHARGLGDPSALPTCASCAELHCALWPGRVSRPLKTGERQFRAFPLGVAPRHRCGCDCANAIFAGSSSRGAVTPEYALPCARASGCSGLAETKGKGLCTHAREKQGECGRSR